LKLKLDFTISLRSIVALEMAVIFNLMHRLRNRAKRVKKWNYCLAHNWRTSCGTWINHFHRGPILTPCSF
ncbi:MAG: hypothetical protein ACKPKO_58350, partial [Candidatus Fonsibacter sp.]